MMTNRALGNKINDNERSYEYRKFKIWYQARALSWLSVHEVCVPLIGTSVHLINNYDKLQRWMDNKVK